MFSWCFSLCTAFKSSDGVSHYVQHSNYQLMFVIKYSIQNVSLYLSSGYSIEMVSWCLPLRTAFKWSKDVSQ
jgi:hypothetical protein